MRFVILIVIILIALGAGYFTLKLATPPQEEQSVVKEDPKVEVANVMVARAPIPVGTIIMDDMVDKQPWPKHLVLDGFVQSDDPNFNVVGMVARSEFQQQEPLIKYKLANPNDANFIAAALPEGMRAITVSVDAISGVAGYIFAGDRVDVTFVHNVPEIMKTNSSTSTPAFAETLLQNVLVLAVDLNGETDARRRKAAANPDSNAEVAAPRNITLAMNESDVQKIRLAEKDGVLSLALRSLKDRESAGESNLTSLSNITSAEGTAKGDSVVIVRGVSVVKNQITPSMMGGIPMGTPSPNPNGM